MPSSFPLGKSLLFTLAAVPLLACSISSSSSVEQKTPPAAAASLSAPEPPKQTVEDEVLAEVSKSLRRAGLLPHPDLCYAYRFDMSPGQPAYIVDVMENHRHPECGGDPETQPHLFTVHVHKKTRALSSDARTPGDFVAIKP